LRPLFAAPLLFWNVNLSRQIWSIQNPASRIRDPGSKILCSNAPGLSGRQCSLGFGACQQLRLHWNQVSVFKKIFADEKAWAMPFKAAAAAMPCQRRQALCGMSMPFLRPAGAGRIGQGKLLLCLCISLC
jgi:hypothetical protein